MRQFYAQLDASRPNTSNPYGSSTWDKQTNFNQAGYDQAIRDWDAMYAPRYEWVGGDDPLAFQPGYMGTDSDPVPSPQSARQQILVNSQAVRNAPPRPTADAFTTYDYSQRSAFNPEMQGRWDQIQQMLDQTLAGIDPNASVDLIDNAGGLYSDQLADAIYRRTTRLTDPQFQQSQNALETRLAERGFQVGNEGYNTEMGRFQRERDSSYMDAADRAQIQAAQQALAEAGFTNSSRLAEFQANQNSRSQIAQLLAGYERQMMAGLQGNQSQMQAPSLPGLDVLGAYNNQYQGQLAQYNADQASDNAMLGTIASLGTMMFAPYLAPALGGLGAAGAAGLGSQLIPTMIPGAGGSYANPVIGW